MDFLAGLGFALAVCLCCLLMASFGDKWNLGRLSAFSAGGLLALSFLDFIPKSFEGSLHEFAGALILAGILAQGLAEVYLAPRLKFLDRLIEGGQARPCRHGHSHLLSPSAVCSTAGCLVICSFFDGVRLFAGLSLKGPAAAMTGIALFFHLLAEAGMATAVGLSAGLKKKVLLALISILSGSLLLGMVLAKSFLAHINLQGMMAFSGGVFVYVCFIHMLPPALKGANKLWLFGGLFSFSAAHYLLH